MALSRYGLRNSRFSIKFDHRNTVLREGMPCVECARRDFLSSAAIGRVALITAPFLNVEQVLAAGGTVKGLPSATGEHMAAAEGSMFP
jgi:hypothetical protein